jgi:hypothetical protein
MTEKRACHRILSVTCEKSAEMPRNNQAGRWESYPVDGLRPVDGTSSKDFFVLVYNFIYAKRGEDGEPRLCEPPRRGPQVHAY